MHKDEILEVLNQLEISYKVIEHRPVFNMEEMNQLELDPKGEIAKNLFIRDKKKRRYFLVVVEKNKKVDLKLLQSQLECKQRLGFASEDDLLQILNLTRGSVSPLGVICDRERKVEVIIDKGLMKHKRIGMHPNVNTHTVWMSPDELLCCIEYIGNKVMIIEGL